MPMHMIANKQTRKWKSESTSGNSVEPVPVPGRLGLVRDGAERIQERGEFLDLAHRVRNA